MTASQTAMGQNTLGGKFADCGSRNGCSCAHKGQVRKFSNGPERPMTAHVDKGSCLH